MAEKRNDAEYMGVKLGTCSGAEGDMECVSFYDFVPLGGFPMPAGDCLSIFEAYGQWMVYDANGNTTSAGTVRPVFSDSGEQTP